MLEEASKLASLAKVAYEEALERFESSRQTASLSELALCLDELRDREAEWQDREAAVMEILTEQCDSRLSRPKTIGLSDSLNALHRSGAIDSISSTDAEWAELNLLRESAEPAAIAAAFEATVSRLSRASNTSQ